MRASTCAGHANALGQRRATFSEPLTSGVPQEPHSVGGTGRSGAPVRPPGATPTT